ncbi:TetR/AcrR family transcriptional regulator [Amycolatopsis sp. H20-H5]|uniref:TetR/AcrR family transcriptional regulator n=1 Tax=Amycolatopsis sp. H20-H5 TaxID=3046309 RepID=UPI002DBD4DAD|nr:TetR family transcriptional regulator [Amycolatopsis sp. H20-H5]MEC3982361.1 TetR family transcriptional regulator [Amycolatopsis sp. H20-H5]
MARDAQETRRKLLEAAAGEFSAYGIAGARVDRIATSAGVNKAMIYSYFGNKEQLFDKVFEIHVVAGTVGGVPITPEDLPGYAGRLFDHYQAHPEISRLANWHRLERGAGAVPAAVVESQRQKLEALEKAQADGTLSARFPAKELLALVLSLSLTGIEEFEALDAAGLAVRRASVLDAVRLITETR